jgi:L-galactose dehydrogenase
MDYRLLGRTGLNVSVLGFGASSLGGVFHAIDETEGVRTVWTAIETGINFIDVSPYYGLTRAESVLGRALGEIKRDRYYLATKVGQYGDGIFDFSAKRVTQSLDESCARLGVDYIDLLQCHDIEFADLEQIIGETLPALIKLRDAGRIGHIGITGLPLKIFPSVIDRAGGGAVETILSFCRYGLNDQSLDSLIPYCAGKGVGVINAAPTGMGLLTPRGVPAWHPAPPAIRQVCRQAVDYCASVGADIVKLALQFATHHPGIATTLVGTANPEAMRQNVRSVEAPVDFELMARVLEILKPIHNHNFMRGRPENRDLIVP